MKYKLLKHMESLYETVLKKKQEVSQITCNPTLGAMDLDYCKILDCLVSTDGFVASRVKSCLKELELAGSIEFNGHYLTDWAFLYRSKVIGRYCGTCRLG